MPAAELNFLVLKVGRESLENDSNEKGAVNVYNNAKLVKNTRED